MNEPIDATPMEEAQARLSTLAAAGAPAARVVLEVGDLVAGWASEADMAGVTAMARMEALWDGFTREASELQEQISDAEGAGRQTLELAQRQLSALQAIVAALQAAHERLTGGEGASA